MASAKVLLAVALCAVASFRAAESKKPPSPCPSYTEKLNCLTGSCDDAKTGYLWKIPSNCPLLEGYGTGAFYLTGTLEEDTSIPSTGGKIKVSKKGNVAKCCLKCKAAASCKYYQFLSLGAFGGLCFTYRGNIAGPTCDTENTYVKTKVGAKCQNSSIEDDPHLVGAHGTPYDFSGIPDKSFCLMSDKNLHINMKMTGYYDARTESATLLTADGKAVRTWIRELGLMWSVDGKHHTLRMAARAGKETARGDGFLAFAEADNSPLEEMVVGTELILEGGLTVKFQAVEKKGSYEVEFYRVSIADLLDMDVRLRVANPLLQTPEDAMAHISLGFNYVQTTPAIHGVLGQTYREDHAERAIEFSKLAAMLHHNIAADGESGKGFLDGAPADYVASSVMDPDCKFSQYQGWAELPNIASVVKAE